jgi:hypothetical protein
MLSKKSKIEQLPKSRESRFLAAAASASLCRTRTKRCGRLLVIRRGPSHRRARDAPAALKNFFHPPRKTFFDSIDPNRKSQEPAAPIRYVAELIGADADSEQAIRWLIALMVLCCDPLAIALTAAASARR